jgi:Mg2+-importing ATPase
VIFAIRTHRVPFFRSHPSGPLTFATLGCVSVGAILPFSPVADTLGFVALPAAFFAFLVAMIVIYLVVVEFAKRRFYRALPEGRPLAIPHPQRPVHHRASRWSVTGPVPRHRMSTSRSD